MLSSKRKFKILLILAIVMLGLSIFSKVNAATQEDAKLVLDEIPNEITVDFKEIDAHNEYEKVNLKCQEIVTTIFENLGTITEGMRIGGYLSWYGDVHEFYMEIEDTNNNYILGHKTIKILYSNSKERDLEFENNLQNIIKKPEYLVIDFSKCDSLEERLKVIEQYYYDIINTENVYVDVITGAGGPGLIGMGHDNILKVFKDDIYYHIKDFTHSCGDSGIVPRITIPNGIKDTEEDYVNYAMPIVKEYLRENRVDHTGQYSDYITESEIENITITKGAKIKRINFYGDGKDVEFDIEDGYTVKGITTYGEETSPIILTKDKPTIKYSTHVQNEGWQSYVQNGMTSGTVGKELRLEGIKIKVNSAYSGNIEYSTHVQNIGWQDFVSNDDLSGTSGQSLRLEAIKIRLTGEISNYYDVYYRVHSQNVGWLDWAKNGEESGTSGFGYRLEGIEIKLVEKGKSAPGKTDKPFKENIKISYSTHVQNEGWQNYVSNGETSGTLGKELRLEGIKIKVKSPYSGNIEYSTHIQNIGWQDFVSNDALSGTLGRSLRLEAIKIRLTGELSNYYDVYYRVHSQNFGWLDWAKNGMPAGTSRYGYRLEGIEIRLVEKGEPAPGNETNCYISK